MKAHSALSDPACEKELSKIAETIKAIITPFNESFKKLEVKIPFSFVSYKFDEKFLLMMKEYKAGKLGDIDDCYLSDVMQKFHVVLKLCTILEGPNQESPGDILLGFYLSLLDVQPITNEAIDKTSVIRTFSNWHRRKASKKSNDKHSLARNKALEIADHEWKRHPETTKEDMKELVFRELGIGGIRTSKGEPYAKTTVYGWITPLVPEHRKKGGRPSNTK